MLWIILVNFHWNTKLSQHDEEQNTKTVGRNQEAKHKYLKNKSKTLNQRVKGHDPKLYFLARKIN